MIPVVMETSRIRRVLTLVATSAMLLAACAPPAEPDPRLVSQWVRSWYGTIRVERLSPPVASRLMAYASTALYAGVASTRPDLPALDGALNGIPSLPRAGRARDHDATVVAVEAERTVLDSLLIEALPTTRGALTRLADSLVNDRATAGVSERVRESSRLLGREIGLAIVAWSRTDGFDGTRGRSYPAPDGPGLWFNDSPANVYATQNLSATSEMITLDNPANQLRAGNASDRGLILSRPKSATSRTLPAVNMSGASEPYWGEVRPFVLPSRDACAIPEPPTYSVDTSSPFYQGARTVAATRAALTEEQRLTAFFWADNAGESGTPVGHWLSIAAQLIRANDLDAATAARMVLATAVSQADAFIASWGYKYQFNLLRPRTYIRRVIDRSWEPLIPTPPFPEYPSGHSTQSAAAAVAIGAFVGDVAFEDSTSVSLGHAVRRFPTLTAAAHEAGRSRIYGGIHFEFGDRAGRSLGECIGGKVAERLAMGAARP